jgi:excisionase family DNA binding protein
VPGIDQELAMNQSIETKSVESPYFTAVEAAVYLRTTVQGVYSLVKRRKLKPMPGRPGRLLFTRDALDSYLNSRFTY